MHANCPTILSTPAICNGFKSEGMMNQIIHAQFSDFITNLNQILTKIEPPYEEDPVPFYDEISSENLHDLLSTFDSALNIFSTVIQSNENCQGKTHWVSSSLFASLFTDYMKMTSEFLTHDFPYNSIFPFIGGYSIIDKYYTNLLCNTDYIYDTQSQPVLASQFQKAWNLHYSIFSNITKLIKSFDFPAAAQRIEAFYQISKNSYGQEDKLNYQSTQPHLFFIQKSFKEKLLRIDENSTQNQIQEVIADCQSFRECLFFHDHTQMINPRYQVIPVLMTHLELTKSLINIKETAIRINSLVNSDNFAIDPADFATKDAQYILLTHAAKTVMFKLDLISRISQAAPFLRKAAYAFNQAVMNNQSDLSESFDRLSEHIHGLNVKIDFDYESAFVSSMKNNLAPENVFNSFKNAMLKSPVTIEDHSQRLISFLEFEVVAKLDLNESNDVSKFKEYLIHNIICVDLQELVTILEQQVPQVEGNLGSLSNESKLLQILSYVRSITLNLNQMVIRGSISKESKLFVELFTIFMEYVEYIIESDETHALFGVISQSINFPSIELIKRAVIDPLEMSNLRVLITQIQMCQEEIGVFLKSISEYQKPEKLPSLSECKEELSRRLSLLSRCDEYIKELFISLNAFKTKSNLFSMYSRFLELIGQQNLQVKITQRITNEIHPSLIKHIKIFARSLLSLVKKSKNVTPFLKFDPTIDFYSSLLIFLKVIFYNENIDLATVFSPFLDALNNFDFSSSLRHLFFEINYIEMILLSMNSKESMNQSIRDYREIVSLTMNYIIHDKLDYNQLNSKIDSFLSTFYYVSPKLFEKIEEHFTSITSFIRQFTVFKNFLNSASALLSIFKLTEPQIIRNRKYEISYFDIIFRNFVLMCMKSVTKISMSDFVQQDTIDYLNGFSYVISRNIPSQPFVKMNNSQFSYIYEAFMNLFNSSVAFYQFSFIPSQSPNQESKILKPDSGIDSYWFLNNFDFLSHLQPLLADLISIISTVDDKGRNLKTLTKMNKMIENRLNVSYCDDDHNVYLFKLAFALKFKKLLEKIHFDSPISQCQYIDAYNQIHSLIDTEINIITLNFSLVVTNLIINEKVKQNLNIIKNLSFVKCSPFQSTSEEAFETDDLIENFDSKIKSLSSSNFGQALNLNGHSSLTQLTPVSNHQAKKSKKFNFARKAETIKSAPSYISRRSDQYDGETDHETETFPIFCNGLLPIIDKSESQATLFKIPSNESLEKCQTMLDEINQLIGSSSRWMHGNLRDASIPIVPLHTAAEEVTNEINKVSKSIYETIAAFSLQNNELVEETKMLKEKLDSIQFKVKEKQQELFERKRNATRTKNVTLYKYTIMLKEFEKKKRQNMKKRIDLEKILINQESMNDSSAEEEESTESQKIEIEPFQPVIVASKIGSSPTDEASAQKELNEALLENEQLRNALRMSNDKLQAARQKKERNSDKTLHKIFLDNQEKIDHQFGTDVSTRFFNSIKKVRSIYNHMDAPISEEVNIEQIGNSLLESIADFRKNSTESREVYVNNSYQLLKKLDKMINVYRAQKERTAKIRDTLQEAKDAKDNYKSALSKILDDENI